MAILIEVKQRPLPRCKRHIRRWFV